MNSYVQIRKNYMVDQKINSSIDLLPNTDGAFCLGGGMPHYLF